jgi:hypothetical protein
LEDWKEGIGPTSHVLGKVLVDELVAVPHRERPAVRQPRDHAAVAVAPPVVAALRGLLEHVVERGREQVLELGPDGTAAADAAGAVGGRGGGGHGKTDHQLK